MKVEDLTMRDIAVVERLSEQSIEMMSSPGVPKARLFAAMCYVIRRKEDPSFTFEDALDLTMSELEEVIDFDDDEDETEDEEEASKSES